MPISSTAEDSSGVIEATCGAGIEFPPGQVCGMHSLRGALAVAMIGGGTPMVDELLLNALSLCDGQQAPGVWAVITAWTPEPIPDDDGQSTTPAVGASSSLSTSPCRSPTKS